MDDNTDIERETMEAAFLASLDDKAKAIINIVTEISRLTIQRKFITTSFVIGVSFDIHKSIDNTMRSWLYIYITDIASNDVYRFEAEFHQDIDTVKDQYNDFIGQCSEVGYSVRTWEQVQSNHDFIQYIR